MVSFDDLLPSEWLNWRTMFSINTIAPSTITPKSNAPKRQQIGGNVHQLQTNSGKQQRKRNGHCNDQGAANIPQK